MAFLEESLGQCARCRSLRQRSNFAADLIGGLPESIQDTNPSPVAERYQEKTPAMQASAERVGAVRDSMASGLRHYKELSPVR